MADKRAETYLRLVAEAELRRAGAEFRRLEAATGPPRQELFAVASQAQWKVLRTGRILVAAGALDQQFLDRLASEFHVAVYVRSRFLLGWDRQRGVLIHSLAEPPSPPPPPPPAPAALAVTPIGRVLRVASDRAPAALHFLSLVRTGTEAVLTVAMRMHWPADGSSADLESSGAGPYHLPYDQLSLLDEQGRRYAISFEGASPSRGSTWRGIARLSPAPPSTVGRLDLVGDRIRLLDLPLTATAEEALTPAGPTVTAAGISPAERLLMLEAERTLTTRNPRGPEPGPDPAEIVAVLTEAGAIAADSPLISQLAALSQHLGWGWAAPTGPHLRSYAEIPARWTSVLTGGRASGPAPALAAFLPVAQLLPEINGARFALAGLSSADGESHLHVIGAGRLPTTADRYQHGWTPGFSWWLRDGTGHWHVATPAENWPFGDDLRSFQLRLTPPLASVTGPLELVVTGPATQLRAFVPIT